MTLLALNPWILAIGSAIASVALLVLLVLYVRGFWRSRTPYRIANFPTPETKNFAEIIASLSDSFLNRGKMTGFWVGAEQIFAARLEAIESARYSIQFETYIMTPGRRADEFARAIAQKAQAGVTVQLLADNFGAKDLPRSYWQRLENAGVEVRIFNPFSWRDPFYHLRRNHRKLLLIDGEFALLGGAGVSDDWDGDEEIGDTQPWLDYETKFEGPAIARLKGLFLQHWLDAGGIADFANQILTPQYGSPPTILISAGEDPTLRDSGLRSLYQSLIQAAQKRIWIASPYFLPDATTRRVLVEAQQRGVEVRVLTMGPPSDKTFIRYTSRTLYGSLLKGGVEIYEYQPSMMHAKALLIDRSWISLGSANFDPRSFFQNDELNLSTAEEAAIAQFETLFLDGFAQSKLITRRDWQRRGLWERLVARFWLLFYWQL